MFYLNEEDYKKVFGKTTFWPVIFYTLIITTLVFGDILLVRAVFGW